MTKKIVIGQIGVCHEHANKIESLRKLPELFDIVGVVDDRNTMAARFAGNDLKPYEGLRWMTEEQLLNWPGLHAVMVETPNTDLTPTAIRCMEHGLAIHMDKPGGEDLELFGQLRKGCEDRKLPFQMGYMFRNNPAMLWCRKAVHQGWLGDIFEIQASMSHNYGGETYQEYIGQFRGGVMFNLGCHIIDFVVSMMGAPENVTPFLKSTPSFPENIKNNCVTVLEYPHATVTLRACSKEINGLNRRTLKICGTNGSVELCPLERFDGKPLTMRLTLLENISDYPAGIHIVNFGVKEDRYRDQLIELAGIINGDIENPYTCEHDYLVQKITLAASGYIEWN